MEDQEIQQWKCANYAPLAGCSISYMNDVRIPGNRLDTSLTELEEQLEVAETRCGSLKSQLDYMKMLYQGVLPCSSESMVTGGEHLLQQTADQLKNAIHQSPQKTENTAEHDENCYESSAPDDVKYYQFLKEIHKIQEIVENDPDQEEISPRHSPRSNTKISKITEQYCTVIENEHESISSERKHVKQIRKTCTLPASAVDQATPDIRSTVRSSPPSPTSVQVPKIRKEHANDDKTALEHAHGDISDYASCLQSTLAAVKVLSSRYVSEKKSDSGKRRNEFCHAERMGSQKQDLVLKLTNSTISSPTVKRKKILKVEKKQKVDSCAGSVLKKTLNSKYDDTFSVISNVKNKRRKGKPKSANSRNIIMTRDMNSTDKGNSKTTKRKGNSSGTHVTHNFRTPLQHVPHNRAEVVEIYHNNAVERGSGSISVSSSKHSKPEDQPRNNNILLKKNGLTQMNYDVTYPHHQQQQISESGQKTSHKYDATRSLEQSKNQELQKYSSRSEKSQINYVAQDSDQEPRKCKPASHPSQYYDPTITRNYESPTIASKLKKVNRSYFNRFNFRNIPFVVSTSITPSHNLGLNIQQVLSIMKTRQPMTTGMTPLLIRKMSKGIKPVSTFLGQINDPYSSKLPNCLLMNRQSDDISDENGKSNDVECAALDKENYESKYTGICLISQRSKKLSDISNMQHSFGQKNSQLDEKISRDPSFEEKKDRPEGVNWPEEKESGCICCPKKSKSYNKILKQYTSRKSITGNPTLTTSALLRNRQEEINIGDNEYNHINSVSGDSKGIREVLIKLHDQFEKLNTEYEKLQEQAAKSNDKLITQQIEATEKELNAKEEEINAVVDLYREVLHLKQQVQANNEKNGFVCITTRSNALSAAEISHSGITRAQITNHMQMLGMRRKNPSNTVREPATATRLAGLLREIQAFQKQLLSS